MKKPLIPFSWYPYSWGLKGKARELAKANYELSGYELDTKLAEIENKDKPKELALGLLEVEANHGKIDDYEYDTKRVLLEHPEDSKELKAAQLEIEFHHGKITENEYLKQKATLNDEPYIAIVNQGFDPSKGIEGVFFEFDWNEKWIELLHTKGYTGFNESHMIAQWYDDVCAAARQDEEENAPPMAGRRVVRPGPNGGPTEYY